MINEKDIFKNGYLDVKVNQVVRDVRKGYKPFFDVIFSLNKLTYNIINNDDIKEYKTDRDIYILDEPTSNLDKHTEDIVVKFILKYFNKKTLIIATHNEKISEICNKFYEIENHKLVSLR